MKVGYFHYFPTYILLIIYDTFNILYIILQLFIIINYDGKIFIGNKYIVNL